MSIKQIVIEAVITLCALGMLYVSFLAFMDNDIGVGIFGILLTFLLEIIRVKTE